MLSKKFLIICAVCLFLVGTPALAKTTALSDLEEIHNISKIVNEPGKPFDRNHWAYQSLKQLSEKYGLLYGKSAEQFASDKPLSRNEAAVILVNLLGKIEKEKPTVDEVDQKQFQIMKNEFSQELTVLAGRVEKLENADKHTFKASLSEDNNITGVMQLLYNGSITNGDNGVPQNFSIPTIDIGLKGKIREHLFYTITTFPSRNFNSSANGLLGDAYVSTDILKNHIVYFGQKRKPIGVEGAQSSYTLETINRSQISRTFGDKRDTGVTITSERGLIDYYGGIYNGNTINSTDNNATLEYVATVAINPLYKTPQYGELKIGGTYDHARTTFSSNLFGVFGKYKYKKFTLLAEYAKKDRYNNTDTPAEGWFIHGAYNFNDKWQLITRFDKFDGNLHPGRQYQNEYTFGVNRYFNSYKLKTMCNYIYIQNPNNIDSNRIMLLTQYMF